MRSWRGGQSLQEPPQVPFGAESPQGWPGRRAPETATGRPTKPGPPRHPQGARRQATDLDVIVRVPVRVVDDDRVRRGQVDAQAARPGREEEAELLGPRGWEREVRPGALSGRESRAGGWARGHGRRGRDRREAAVATPALGGPGGGPGPRVGTAAPRAPAVL